MLETEESIQNNNDDEEEESLDTITIKFNLRGQVHPLTVFKVHFVLFIFFRLYRCME